MHNSISNSRQRKWGIHFTAVFAYVGWAGGRFGLACICISSISCQCQSLSMRPYEESLANCTFCTLLSIKMTSSFRHKLVQVVSKRSLRCFEAFAITNSKQQNRLYNCSRKNKSFGWLWSNERPERMSFCKGDFKGGCAGEGGKKIFYSCLEAPSGDSR